MYILAGGTELYSVHSLKNPKRRRITGNTVYISVPKQEEDSVTVVGCVLNG